MDNVIYLARCIPRMCMPVDSPYYEWSHDVVYEYICDTMDTDYENYRVLPPTGDNPNIYIVHVRGGELRRAFPLVDNSLRRVFSFDPIRANATYAVVVRRFEEGEIVEE